MSPHLSSPLPDTKSFKNVTWSCPSNIAIIKYWGKCGRQVPCNPSVSLTLDSCVTVTTLSWKGKTDKKTPWITAENINNEAKPFYERIHRFLKMLQSEELPWIQDFSYDIKTRNTFPHAAGIASSASAFAALSLCLCSVAMEEHLTLPYPDDLFRSAARIARLGSGSATRSLYGGWVWWGKDPEYKAGSNDYGLPLENVHPLFRTLRDTILVVSSDTKPVSSTAGHQLMKDNPYAPVRYRQSRARAKKLLDVLQTGDWDTFAEISRQEALDLHGLMMTSAPGYLLMLPETVKIIHTLEQEVRQKKIKVTWTLDAGPNVHLLYPKEEAEAVKELITNNLSQWCERGKWIEDGAGRGPVKRRNHDG